MISPDDVLLTAIVVRLKATAALTGIVSTRIYDQPPAKPTFPYVSLGEGQTLQDEADCVDGSECFLNIHAWSREPGFPEARSIVSAIRDALDHTTLTLTGHRLTDIMFESVDYVRDPDGLTSHAAMTIRALTEPA